MTKIAAVDRKQQKDAVERVRGKLRMLIKEGKLAAMLVNRIDPDHFMQLCMTHYLQGGTRMMQADPLSFVKACVEAAQLGLKPDGILGECYLIPRNISVKVGDRWDKRLVVQFQMGYHGLAKLIRRSEQVVDLSPHVVYGGDVFEVYLGTDQRIVHRPYYQNGKKDRGDVVAAYNIATLSNGSKSFRVVDRIELDRAAEASGDPSDKKPSNVWVNHYDAMCMKTALLRHGKWLPMPDDCRRAVNREEQREEGLVDDDLASYIDTDAFESDHEVDGPPTDLDDLVPTE